MAVTLSIAAGPTETPLLEQTIGANLEATVNRFPDREALVVVHQGIRQTWSEFDSTISEVANGAWYPIRRPGGHVESQLC